MTNLFYGVILSLFVLLFGSIGLQTSYAERLTYDEKLEFAFKIEQISSHMISSLDNIIQNEFDIAKMHLVHPAAEHSDVVDFLADDSVCAKKLPLVLEMLKETEPGLDKSATDVRFAYVFQTLNECNASILGTDVDSNLGFNVELIDRLLEKSVSEYELSTHVTGLGQLMEYQDALGLVIRAHMMIDSTSIFDAEQSDVLSTNFEKLFLAYHNNSSLRDVAYLTNQIRGNLLSLDDGTAVHTSFTTSGIVTPTVYLNSMNFSHDLKLLELSGEHFDSDQKVTIEYFSPVDEKVEVLRGTTTSNGEFSIPLEFIDDSFDEPMMFEITVNNSILNVILSIS